MQKRRLQLDVSAGRLVPFICNKIVEKCYILKEMIELQGGQNKARLGVSKSRTEPGVAGGIGVPTEESADETSISRVRDASRIKKIVMIAPQWCNSYKCEHQSCNHPEKMTESVSPIFVANVDDPIMVEKIKKIKAKVRG